MFNEIDLAAGDVYGSCVFNLLIIAILDLIYRNKPILSSVGNTPIIVAGLSIVLISTSIFGILYMEYFDEISLLIFNRLDPISIVLLVLFVISMFIIYKIEKNNHESEDAINTSDTLKKSGIIFFISATIIIICAVWLANVGKNIAIIMEWETSFVGTQFLAFSTSLPELAASIAALRINAPELAITNLLGSNLFNMGFVLFVDDLVYQNGVVWAHVSWIHGVTALIAVLMTSVVIVSLVYYTRNESGKSWKITVAPVLIGCYVLSSLLAFYMG